MLERDPPRLPGQSDADRVRQLFDYDPAAGLLLWRVYKGDTCRIGQVAGSRSPRGYWRVRFDGKGYFAHRVIWLHQHGAWPNGMIDHIDGDPMNNRIGNLREADAATNSQNLRTAQRNNRTGFLGVIPFAGGFAARIKHRGKQYHSGGHATAEAAHSAYLALKRQLHAGSTL